MSCIPCTAQLLLPELENCDQGLNTGELGGDKLNKKGECMLVSIAAVLSEHHVTRNEPSDLGVPGGLRCPCPARSGKITDNMSHCSSVGACPAHARPVLQSSWQIWPGLFITGHRVYSPYGGLCLTHRARLTHDLFILHRQSVREILSVPLNSR